MTTVNETLHIKLEELHPNPYQPPSRIDVDEEPAGNITDKGGNK